jgi:hypothetical protein
MPAHSELERESLLFTFGKLVAIELVVLGICTVSREVFHHSMDFGTSLAGAALWFALRAGSEG